MSEQVSVGLRISREIEMADTEPSERGTYMSIKARLGAGQWDILVCEECQHTWNMPDIDPTWTDEPEPGDAECPACFSTKVTREERG